MGGGESSASASDIKAWAWLWVPRSHGAILAEIATVFFPSQSPAANWLKGLLGLLNFWSISGPHFLFLRPYSFLFHFYILINPCHIFRAWEKCPKCLFLRYCLWIWKEGAWHHILWMTHLGFACPSPSIFFFLLIEQKLDFLWWTIASLSPHSSDEYDFSPRLQAWKPAYLISSPCISRVTG